MARGKKGLPVNGWCVLDKPYGMTSTKAVGVVRAIFNAQKAGHAGTLDPLASGLLPIALGEATKTVPFAMDGAKEYQVTVRWGQETNTDDAEGEITEQSDRRPNDDEITAILPRYTGLISQVPPQFSAIKMAGKRAYDLARAGEKVEIAARNVQIDGLELVARPDPDHATFNIACGKGTYIRALARDMGRDLGCFGHVVALRRTFVKPFSSRDMILLEKLEELSHKGADRDGLLACLLPIDAVLDDILAVLVDQSQAFSLRQGRAIILRGRDAPINEDLVIAKHRGKPVALASVEKGMLKPKRVFNLNQTPS
ncbi:MAG TPA: tRNA pseudouridine(55) synthase TruB [Rhizobiales bacterium]|nr:tRNA pseudouridine(55) synthase TruB [Hyphomicrobiales bacterium]